MNEKNKPDLSNCKMGSIYLKLAETEDELIQAQKLRQFVFFEEPSGANQPSGKIDSDEFDDVCEHLLVMTEEEVDEEKKARVVGTYRLLRRTSERSVDKFYTETEFDITGLKNSEFNLLELGRSCIHPDFRDGRVIQLLWAGIGTYIAHYNINYMFGCGSFFGVDPQEHAIPISYLFHNHMAPEDICPVARDEVAGKLDILPSEEVDRKEAFSKMPALLKGYMRTGCMVGDGVVIDNICKTVDVCIIMDTSKIAKRYSEHFVDKNNES